MRPVMRLAAFVGVSVLLAAVSACTSPRPCAGVGVESGVSVLFLRDGYADLRGASYELCARGACVKGTLTAEDLTRVRLHLPDDVDPDSGPVRFRVTRQGSASPEIDASTDVELTHQSDGCGGGAYNRGLAFTEEDGLTANIPASVTQAWRKHIESLASPSESPS